MVLPSAECCSATEHRERSRSPMHSLHHDERDHVSLDLYKAVALWQQLVVTKERANIVRLTTVEEFDKQSAPGQPLEPLAKRLLEIDDFQYMEIDDIANAPGLPCTAFITIRETMYRWICTVQWPCGSS